MKTAIKIENLSKEYHRIDDGTPYLTIRDTLAGIFMKNTKRKARFSALDDISLEINEGDRVGIVGKNGAGKSTLLKVISRITPPTKGRVIVEGRVASLLEVGTGFHPELTGRENIYLNGSILGLKRHEINARLSDIIEFSGVKDFINTPLKNYSSGMQLRLAFSVAAHLEPEILMIDEVLAVGDMEFQKKCIAKMEEVSQQSGRTILFVSHNINYISALCNKGLLLHNGQSRMAGPIQKVIREYMTLLQCAMDQSRSFSEGEYGDHIVQLLSLRMINENGRTGNRFNVTEKIGIEMRYQVLRDDYILWLGHNLHNDRGIHVFDVHDVNNPLYRQPHKRGRYTATVWIPANFLNTGSYLVSSGIFNHLEQTIHFHIKEALLFSVDEVFDRESARGSSPGEFLGVVRPILNWNIEKE